MHRFIHNYFIFFNLGSSAKAKPNGPSPSKKSFADRLIDREREALKNDELAQNPVEQPTAKKQKVLPLAPPSVIITPDVDVDPAVIEPEIGNDAGNGETLGDLE